MTRLTSILGILGSVAAAAAPLLAMWGVKEWVADTSHDQERVGAIQNNVAAPAKGMLSWFGIDKEADIERRRAANRAGLDTTAELAGQRGLAGNARPSLVAASQVKASGQIDVNFRDAPPGTRIEQIKSGGDVPINTSVGWRSDALGMP